MLHMKVDVGEKSYERQQTKAFDSAQLSQSHFNWIVVDMLREKSEVKTGKIFGGKKTTKN